MLRWRAATALVLAPVALGAIILGKWAVLVVVLLVVAVAAYELSRALEPLPFDTAAARAYALVYAAVMSQGRKPRGPRALDLLIAATACAHGLPLYTRNPDDLRGLEDLVEVVAV